MAQPKKRHDAYGRPLPTLAPVESRSLVQSAQNTAMRRYLVWLLEHKYAALFTPDSYMTVHLTLHIKQGTLQSEVDTQITYQDRYEGDNGEG